MTNSRPPLQFLDTRADRAWAMEWINTILALNGLVTTAAQRNDIASAIVNMEKNQAYTLSEFSVTVQDEQIRETISKNLLRWIVPWGIFWMLKRTV